jgi:hypothetical protein
MQKKKLEVALSAAVRAMEIVPSRCESPVRFVLSRRMGGKPSLSFCTLTLAWMTSIRTSSFG